MIPKDKQMRRFQLSVGESDLEKLVGLFKYDAAPKLFQHWIRIKHKIDRLQNQTTSLVEALGGNHQK